MRGTTTVAATSCGGAAGQQPAGKRSQVDGVLAVADLHASALMHHMRTCLSDCGVPVPERLRRRARCVRR